MPVNARPPLPPDRPATDSRSSGAPAPLILEGTAVSGLGRAAAFTRLPWVRAQCCAKLGFEPFPGTFNVRLDPRAPLDLEGLAARAACALVSPEAGGCDAALLPIEVGGYRAAIVIPERHVRRHADRIVEIIAALRLRDALKVDDGDAVRLVLCDPPRDRRRPRERSKLVVAAVMLDLDGTLIDSVGHYTAIVAAVLEEMGLPPVSRQRLSTAALDGEFDWLRVMPRMPATKRSAAVARAWRLAAEIGPRLFARGLRLFPGVETILERIVRRDRQMAIVTSTPRAHLGPKLEPLAAAGLEGLFATVVAGSDVARKKPNAEPLLTCAARLGVSPGQTVYVGDMRSDVQAGKAAGTRTVGVLTGFDDRSALQRAGPDAIIDSVAFLDAVVAL